jgi:hypothetical protein
MTVNNPPTVVSLRTETLMLSLSRSQIPSWNCHFAHMLS